MYVCPQFRAFCMEMRRLTGDESDLWFVWQKQESNNWSFTASELACLFCFIEHVKAQGSQNITIYHPSKNMPSWQKNQNTTYYKDSKLSLDEWRMQKQKCAHQVPTLFWNWATTIYTETNQHFTDTAIKLKRLSFLYNHYLSKLEEGLVKWQKTIVICIAVYIDFCICSWGEWFHPLSSSIDIRLLP